jgi:hypothetical protein
MSRLIPDGGVHGTKMILTCQKVGKHLNGDLFFSVMTNKFAVCLLHHINVPKVTHKMPL